MLIDTSLNFASVMGILLSSTSAIFSIVYFLENERINFIHNVIILLSFIGGLILSFQGWKLDPILQICLLLVIIPYIFTSFKNLFFDFQKWQKRIN